MANDYIEILKERDKEKPIKKLFWTPGANPLPSCPSCGELIYTERGNFCVMCGQRIDKQNWEF